MNESKKSVLQKHRDKIVKDLDVDDILDELYSKEVINNDEKERISFLVNRKAKTVFLLDILSTKKNEYLEIFMETLKKDYTWLSDLFEKSIGCVNEDEYVEQKYCEALILGDMPQLPVHYVPRKNEEHRVIEKLRHLKRGHYLVIHGMVGLGKSVLAVSAIRNSDLLSSCFNNCLYFITAGQAKNRLDIAQLLYRLYTKLNDDYNRDFTARLIFDEVVINFMKDKLKKIFLAEPRRQALIVLDDVCIKEVVDAFDFGCKTLITTQDLSVVPQQNRDLFELKTGFNEHESLQLLSSCVDIKIENLPSEAKKIHSIYKGAPLLITVIGSYIEEWKEEATKKERWKEYINMVMDKKDSSLAKAYKIFFRRKKNDGSSEDYLFNTIKHRLDSLPKDYQEYYKHFALFVEDVNITPRVMEIILDKKPYEVIEILTKLKNKSLIVNAYNKELESYVYGIHDLLLAHLKQILTEDEKIKLHTKLLENYLKVSDGDFAKLPNDNYIYTYIGYHLAEAKRFDDFPKVYFNLNFIGAKIKDVGIAYLIGDFKRYKNFITKNNDPQLSKKLENFESFVQKYGQDLYKYPATDIIQCALQQSCTSDVYEAALEIAQKQCANILYLQTHCLGQTLYVTHTLDLDEDVYAACFAHQANIILVGTGSGEINLWDHSYKNRISKYTGHTKKILQLQLTDDVSKFLSVSEDGSVKIWHLEKDQYDQNGIGNGMNTLTLSPRIRQEGSMSFFGDTPTITKCETHTVADDQITAASFSYDDGKYVLIGTQKGLVQVWTWSTNKHPEIIRCLNPITCCTFSLNNSVLLFASDNVIFLYDFIKGEYLSQFTNDVRTTSLLVVPQSPTQVVAISDKSVRIWRWEQTNKEDGGVYLYSPIPTILDSREDVHYICGAVTWDGLYVVIGSSDHYIHMWNLETKQKVKEMLENHGLVVSLDTYLNEESNSNVMYILLSGSDNKTVKHWHIQNVENQKRVSSKLVPQFSTCWIHETIPLIAALTSENRIQVFNSHTLIAESEIVINPTYISFNPAGTEIAVGLEDGKVNLYDYKNKKYNSVMDLEGKIDYLDYMNSASNNSSVLIAGAENSCLMVYRDRKTIRLKQPKVKNSLETTQSSQTTVKSFLFAIGEESLLTVEKDKSIKIWYFNGIKNVLVARDLTCTVTMATMTNKQKFIALTFADGNFKIYEVVVSSDGVVSCVYSHGKKFEDILRSCCFSNDGKLLALGQDSGDIVLWNVEDQVELTTLQIHKSWVRDLAFSPSSALDAPMVLVSVGDQIVWWDITYVWTETVERLRKTSKRRASGRFSGPSDKIIAINATSQMDYAWVGKRGRDDNRAVLSAFKLTAAFATKISISPDFTCFVTIDQGGLLYIMNVLKPQ